MVHPPKRGVIDDRLRSRDERCEPAEAIHRSRCLSSRFAHRLDVEDDPGPGSFATGSDEDELRAPRRLAIAFEVQRGVGLGPPWEDLSGGLVDALLTWLGSEERRDHLPVGVEESVPTGVREGSLPRGVEETLPACLGDGRGSEAVGQSLEGRRVGEITVSRVEIVMASDRCRRQPHVRASGELRPNGGSDEVPHDRMTELCFNLSGAAIDADHRGVAEHHEPREHPRAAASLWSRRSQLSRQLVQRRVAEDGFDLVQRRPVDGPLHGRESPSNVATRSRLLIPRREAISWIGTPSSSHSRARQARTEDGFTLGSAPSPARTRVHRIAAADEARAEFELPAAR